MNHHHILSFVFTLFATALAACSGSSSPVCGNGVLEQGEDCDQQYLGGQTCEGLGHTGGTLSCTEQCSLDESGCWDCQDGDPCEGVSCGPGSGQCLEFDCHPYCDCDPGYLVGQNLTCQPADTCTDLGQTCSDDAECCSGWCNPFDGLCGLLDCIADFQCDFLATDGQQGCCVMTPAGLGYDGRQQCAPTNVNGSCGDRNGTCGAPCNEGLTSDCRAGSWCLGYGGGYPYNFCAAPCESDADCAGCTTHQLPGSSFSCLSATASGQKYCVEIGEPCSSTADCAEDLVCTKFYMPDGSLQSFCDLTGALRQDEPCNYTDYDSTPWEERCAGYYCYNYRCSEWCESDAECPEDMLCSSNESTANRCFPAPGSRTPCTKEADCPAGEACNFYLDLDGHLTQICVTQVCDPADDDCQDVNEPCGAGYPPCANNVCGTWNGKGFCLAFCEVTDDCPPNMHCWDQSIGDGSMGDCVPD